MKYEYVGYFIQLPFDDSTITSFKGYVEAEDEYEAYTKADECLAHAPHPRNLMNWYVRKVKQDA